MQDLGLWDEFAFHHNIGKYVGATESLKLRDSNNPHWTDLARKKHYSKFAKFSINKAREEVDK